MFTRPAVDLVGARATASASAGSFDTLAGAGCAACPSSAASSRSRRSPRRSRRRATGQIRALVTSPATRCSRRPTARGSTARWRTLDFMVSIDFYLNETTRHAHVILPPTVAARARPLRPRVPRPRGAQHRASYSPPLFPSPRARGTTGRSCSSCRARLEAARRTRRLRLALKRALLRRARPATASLDLAAAPRALRRRAVPVRRRPEPAAGCQGAPHGVDLGPLDPCLPERLGTNGRRIDLAPARLVADLERLQAAAACARGPPNGLLLDRPARPAQQQLVDAQQRAPGEGPRPLHAADAPRRRRRPGLGDGAPVRVSSRVGAVVARLGVSDDMMPGVVSLPHGWGHGRDGVRLRVAPPTRGSASTTSPTSRWSTPCAATRFCRAFP